MKKRIKQKKKNLNLIIISIICGIAIGLFVSKRIEIYLDLGFKEYMIRFMIQIMLLLITFLIQLILHEVGHLVCGLISGYQFSSFRIGPFMLLKTKEGYSFKLFSLAGTGGQCLLLPPEKSSDGTYPYKLYHLGGILINGVTAVLSLAVYFVGDKVSSISDFLVYLAFAGFICMLTNGIPMNIGEVPNDGHNVIHIGKDPFSLEAMWIQLKINQAQVEGIRLKDMPKEWFIIPELADKQNEIVSTMLVLQENLAMDMHDFDKAKSIIDLLDSEEEYHIHTLYKNLLLFDRATIDLFTNGRDADISYLYDKKIKAFQKVMDSFPAIIRTEYAIKLIKEQDVAGAQKLRTKFNKVAKRYPTKAEINSEAELMEMLSLEKSD